MKSKEHAFNDSGRVATTSTSGFVLRPIGLGRAISITMKRIFQVLLLPLLLPLPLTHAAENEERSVFDRETMVSFPTLAGANQPIDPQKVDFDLLSAAIFFATNERRIAEGLEPLKDLPKLREAAAMQAEIMLERSAIAHVNPGRPERETPWKRVKKVGLDPRFAAENVATNFLLAYESNKPFYARLEDERQAFSYEPQGDLIKPHTYVSFASSLLDQWMNSPGHRKNILAETPTHLGCAARLARREGTMDVFYCAQVFFAPMTPP